MNVHDAIKTRRAVRLFSDQPVSDEIIQIILDAGRRSQSSKNTQPWQFIAIHKRETLVALSKLGDFAGHMAGANFGVVLIGNSETPGIAFDIGQAAALMQLAAWEQGVGSCIASIYQPDEAKALLNIPADKYVRYALSFGYPAPEHKPAKLGGRKELDEVVRWETWE
jgi:nitroreductase